MNTLCCRQIVLSSCASTDEMQNMNSEILKNIFNVHGEVFILDSTLIIGCIIDHRSLKYQDEEYANRFLFVNCIFRDCAFTGSISVKFICCEFHNCKFIKENDSNSSLTMEMILSNVYDCDIRSDEINDSYVAVNFYAYKSAFRSFFVRISSGFQNCHMEQCSIDPTSPIICYDGSKIFSLLEFNYRFKINKNILGISD